MKMAKAKSKNMGTSMIGALAVDSHRYFEVGVEVGAEVALFCGVESKKGLRLRIRLV